MKSRILALGLIAVLIVTALILTAGCMGLMGPKPKVVHQSATESFSLSKGVVYKVNAQIRNDGSDGDVTVIAQLFDAEKGFTRDQASQRVFISSGETRQVSFTLDGEFGRDYQYRVDAH
jgi:hypothetical protein